jgi:lauroyl/myristoyl acyltransferase
MSTIATDGTPNLVAAPSTADVGPSLATVLQDLQRPLKPPAMPPASLGIRVRTTPLLRRVTPTRIVVARAERQGRALWESNPAQRAQARAAIEAIVAGTHRADEVEALARDYTIENEAHRALFWQPWKAARLDAQSHERLREALAQGRGVLLSSCHMGPFFHSASLGASVGRTLYAVGGPWCFEPPSPDYWGRRVVRRLRGLSTHGGRLVRSVGAFPVLQELLRDGELVFVQFDVPGSHPTDFLGKPVMLTQGSARLALQADAPILPLRPRRDAHRVWMDIQAPLDPRDFTNVGELHWALADIHERLILELPHTLEDPHRPGFWEEGATAHAWTRPTFQTSPASMRTSSPALPTSSSKFG